MYTIWMVKMIRALTPADFDEIKRIHEKHFKGEFLLPDFARWIYAVVVEDEEGIISMGGIRNIAEVITITDKDRSPSDRIKALYNIMDASIFIAQRCGFEQLYAFSQNPKWAKRLQKNGFRPPQGQALILDL